MEITIHNHGNPTQIFADKIERIDLSNLATQLASARETDQVRNGSAELDEKLKAAEEAAKEGNRSKVLEYLQPAAKLAGSLIDTLLSKATEMAVKSALGSE